MTARAFLPAIGLCCLFTAISCRQSETCLAIYKSIGLRVIDRSGFQQAGILDSFYVLTSTGSRITYDSNLRSELGYYPIVDDAYRAQFEGRTEVLRFHGYQNGAQIVDTPFVVTGDKCHVIKVSGPDSVVLR